MARLWFSSNLLNLLCSDSINSSLVQKNVDWQLVMYSDMWSKFQEYYLLKRKDIGIVTTCDTMNLWSVCNSCQDLLDCQKLLLEGLKDLWMFRVYFLFHTDQVDTPCHLQIVHNSLTNLPVRNPWLQIFQNSVCLQYFSDCNPIIFASTTLNSLL